MALTRAGFRAGKTVLAPAIGGSVGNAATQLAHAQGAKTCHLEHDQPQRKPSGRKRKLGFKEVIDTSFWRNWLTASVESRAVTAQIL